MLENESNSVILNRSLLKTSFGNRFSHVATITGHFAPCFSVTFDKSENRIITGSDDGSVKIWCSQTGILIHSLLGHETAVSDISCSPNNLILASCSLDGSARFWHMQSGQHLSCIMHSSSFHSVQFHPILSSNGIGQVCLSSSDGFVYIWQFKMVISSGKNDITLTILPSVRKFLCRTAIRHGIQCCTFTQGGFRIIVGSTDGFIRMIRTDCEQNVTTNKNLPIGPPDFNLFEQHEGNVSSVHCSYRDGRFVTGSWDGTARIWSFDKVSLLWTSQQLDVYRDGPKFQTNPDADQRNKVLLVLWSIDDTKVITSSDDCCIRVWNVFTGELMFRLPLHTDLVYILAGHPKIDSLILSAGWDGRIALWDITTGKLVASFMYEGRKFNDGQFNNDGTLFVLVDERGSLLIFSMGLTREAYSQAPVEQFFPVDFGHVTYDGGNNPLDTVTLLPIHLSARTGSKNINGIPNAVICPNYGLDFGTEQSEIDFGYERCDVERFLQEEYQCYLLEKSNPALPTATDMENKIKRRKKLKFEDIDEVQEVASDDAQTIRDFVNAYDSASDDAFTETTAAYISPEQLRRREDFEEQYVESEQDSDEFNQYSGSTSSSSEYSESEEISQRRRPRRPVSRVDRQQRFHLEQEMFDSNAPLLPYEYPAEWTLQTTSTIIPYIPQLGDEICYFRQGHQQFLDLVPNLPSLFIQSLPWDLFPDLGPVTEGTVSGLEFLVGPPTVIKMQITMLTRRRQIINIPTFKVVYYDHPEMTDFVILRQRYEDSQNKFNLRQGTKVKVIFTGDALYDANIVASEPFSPEFPDSPWHKYTVQWEDESNDEDSKCSPWELLKRNETLRLPRSFFVPDSLYEEFLAELLSKFEIFKDPIDFEEYPLYARSIGYPICLEVINQRLQNGYYRTLAHFKFECKLIVANAKAFNRPGSMIYKEAVELNRQMDEFFEASSSQDEHEELPSSSRNKRTKRSTGIIDSDDGQE